LTEYLEGIQARFSVNLWFPVLSPSTYKEMRDKYLRAIYRSRGKHSPGSGSYVYGAVTAKPTGVRNSNNNERVIYPGYHEVIDRGSWRYEVKMVGDVVYYLYCWKSGNRWVYAQCQPFRVRFWRDTSQESGYAARCYRLYRVPDSFTSSEWLSVDAFPWVEHSGTEDQRAYKERITLTYSPTKPDTYYLAGMFDRLTLAYEPWVQGGIAASYVDAISKAPINRTNNVANCIAVLQLLMGMGGPDALKLNVLEHNPGDSFKTFTKATRKEISDLWLKYRYVLSTTEMDISETVEYAERFANVSEGCRCHGYYAMTVDNAKYEFHTSLKLSPANLKDLQTDLGRMGMELSAYNAWDLVPYSFIVDWFFRIGDKLEFYEDRNRALKLVPEDIWYSVVRRVETDETSEDYYFRWTGDRPDLSYTFIEDGDPKKATIIKRAVDVFALTSK